MVLGLIFIEITRGPLNDLRVVKFYIYLKIHSNLLSPVPSQRSLKLIGSEVNFSRSPVATGRCFRTVGIFQRAVTFLTIQRPFSSEHTLFLPSSWYPMCASIFILRFTFQPSITLLSRIFHIFFFICPVLLSLANLSSCLSSLSHYF